MNSKKLIIAGGGTGGHIFPALAIANALKKADPGIEILFVGAAGKMEMEKVPQAGFRIIGIDIAGFNRSSLIKNVSLPFKLVKSFFQVRKNREGISAGCSDWSGRIFQLSPFCVMRNRRGFPLLFTSPIRSRASQIFCWAKRQPGFLLRAMEWRNSFLLQKL